MVRKNVFFLLSITIVVDKQVAEKKERRVHEWETKLQRDKKYVNKDALFFSFDFINSIIIVDNNNILTALTILSFFS